MFDHIFRNTTFKILDNITMLAAYVAAAGYILSLISKPFKKKYDKFLRMITKILVIVTLVSALIHVAIEYYVSGLSKSELK